MKKWKKEMNNGSAPQYWSTVASKEHVDAGVEQGIAQFCHGKLGPAKRVNEGDQKG
jgi:hypothetical protein